MRHHLLPIFCLAISGLLSLSACKDSDPVRDLNPSEQERNLTLVIMHDNDVHCAVEGYEYFAGMRDAIISADTAYVATVSSGDFLQGGAMGGISKGEYIIELMNAVGFDAVTLGNHEFDYGVPRLQELTSKLKTEVTCVNFSNTGTSKQCYAPFVMKQMGPKKVAFVGTVTPSTITSEASSFVDQDGNPLPYSFMEAETIGLIQQAVNKARSEGADYVILLSHLGEFERGSKVYALPVIEQTTGINAVLDGHTHSVISEQWHLNAQGDSVLLTQTGTKFSHFGKLIISTDGRCHSECIADSLLADYKHDEVASVLKSLKDQTSKVMDQIVASSDFDLIVRDAAGTDLVRYAETNMGDYVTDAIRFVCNTDVAVLNGGAIRNNVMAGDISYRNFFDSMPYANDISVVEVTGRKVIELLEYGCKFYPTPIGSFLQVSGIRYAFDPKASPRVQTVEILDKDGSYKAIDPEHTYTLSTINHLLNPNYANPALKDCKHLSDNVINDMEAILKYSAQIGGKIPERYAQPGGRIVVLNNNH